MPESYTTRRFILGYYWKSLRLSSWVCTIIRGSSCWIFLSNHNMDNVKENAGMLKGGREHQKLWQEESQELWQGDFAATVSKILYIRHQGLRQVNSQCSVIYNIVLMFLEIIKTKFPAEKDFPASCTIILPDSISVVLTDNLCCSCCAYILPCLINQIFPLSFLK